MWTNSFRVYLAVAFFSGLGSLCAAEQTPQFLPEQESQAKIQPYQGNKEPTNSNQQHLPFPQSLPTIVSERIGEAGQKDGIGEGSEFLPSAFGYRLKVTDTLIVTFTALLFFATIGLWVATRRLVIGAEKTAERQLRAYVHAILAPESQVQIIVGRKAECPVKIKNYGTTPAYDVICEGNIVIGDFVLTNKLPELKLEKYSKTVLAPGQDSQTSIYSNDPINIEDINNISNRSKRAYIYGIITYVDAFNVKRETRYRLMTADPVDGDVTVYCYEGNSAT